MGLSQRGPKSSESNQDSLLIMAQGRTKIILIFLLPYPNRDCRNTK